MRAIALLKRVRQERRGKRDPLSANAATALAQVLYFTRRFDQAEVAARAALELDPTYLTTSWFLGHIHLVRQ